MNSWNVNSEGNVNNNNRYNSNWVVPLIELKNINMRSYNVPLSDIFDAIDDCMKKKRGSPPAILFDMNCEKEAISLWKEINARTYTIGVSYASIVYYPVIREIFAARFRDRVIHHYIAMRIEPLFEDYLYPCMMSNRKNKGTSAAVNDVAKNIYECSEGYTKDCWIWKFDLQGFFMSIDKRILAKKLITFIDERYYKPDKEVLMWLIEKVVMHCPQKNCIRVSPIHAWDRLPKNKSLFCQDDFHGLAIGNLTSQMFANFLLKEVIDYCIKLGLRMPTEFVDDFTLVERDKDFLKSRIPALRKYLKDELGITMHPKKSTYMQYYTKGVPFVGAIIKPHRIYLSKRARRKAGQKFHYFIQNGTNELFRDKYAIKFAATINSYYGLAKHYSTRKFKELWGSKILKVWGNEYYFNNNWNKCVIKKRYTLKGKSLIYLEI